MDDLTKSESPNSIGLHPAIWALVAFCLGLLSPAAYWFGQDGGRLASLFGQPMFLALLLVPVGLAVTAWLIGNRYYGLTVRKGLLADRAETLADEVESVKQRLEDALEENQQSKEKFTRTTTRMRIRVARLLSPDRNLKRVELLDIFDLDILQDIQDAFAVAFNMSSEIRDPEAGLITRPSNQPEVCKLINSTVVGKQECFWFQRGLVEKAARYQKPIYKYCKACGLICGGAPIIVDDRHIATWMAGLVRTDEFNEDTIIENAEQLGFERHVVLGAVRSAPRMSLENFEAALELLWFITREISSMGFNNIQLARDVVRRKRAEREAQLGWHALDQIPEATILTAPNGRIVAVNQAATTLLQHSRKDLLNKKLKDFHDESSGEVFGTPIVGTDPTVATFRTGDGPSVEVSLGTTAVEIDKKQFKCIVAQPAAAAQSTDRIPAGRMAVSTEEQSSVDEPAT